MTTSFITPDNTWAIMTIIAGCVAISLWLEQRYTWAGKLSPAVLLLIAALFLSNFGIIPIDAPAYDMVWGYVVPLSIPLLLFQSDIGNVLKESKSFLFMFLVGSVGTVCGALIGYALLKDYIPELNYIAAMMTGSYIGGGVNFAALSDTFKVSGSMISATTVADNLTMGVYFCVLLLLPSIQFLYKRFRHPHIDALQVGENSKETTNLAKNFWKPKNISLLDIATCGAIAFTVVTISGLIASFLGNTISKSNALLEMLNCLLGNKYLWITTISVVLASTFPSFFKSINGSQELGTYLICFFFFVIAAPASIELIIKNSPLLFIFTIIMVTCNLVVMLIVGYFTKTDLETIILASNANIGGPTTAAGMAIAKGWTKLIGPCVLMGTLGYVIGTYLGIVVGNML